MARFKFGRPISLRWNGLLVEGPAETVFEIPDEYYEEFNEDIGGVEPTLVWLDADEGATVRARVTALELASGSFAILDAKGDLISATADNTAARLGVGANGTVLTADSSTATGLAWATNVATSSFGVRQYVKNTSGVSIAKGKAVYITGATGTNVTVGLADYDSETTSSKTLGLMESTVAHNDFGYVVTEGILTGFDTTGAATEGVAIWLGASGSLIYGSPPSEPYHTVYLGVVSRKNVSNGEVLVKVQNGYELTELHNVSAAAPADNDVIQYDTASGLWKNETLANAGISATSHAHAGVYDPAGTTSTHAALTTSVHGITNTANLIDTSSNRILPSGGTTGQVLSKVSGTNYDVTWSTASGGGASLSNTNAVALGTASAGTASEASRQDHVHPTTNLATLTGTETLTNKTLALPVIDNPRIGYTTQAVSASTVTLTASSNMQQYFTGSAANQTVVLPVTSTLVLGQQYEINNESPNQNVAVQSSGLNAIATVLPGMVYKFTCILTSGTTAASWSADVVGSNAITGTGSMVFNTQPTFSGLRVNRQLIFGQTSVTTAGTTTSLTSSSNGYQRFTGTSNQTVALPSAVNDAGARFEIENASTGVLTVNASGGTLVASITRGETWLIIANSVSTTLNTNWNATRLGGGLPTGSVTAYLGTNASIPTGWLLCDGSLVSRTTFANLFAAIGTTFSAGDGSTTFGVPDLTGNLLVGASAAASLQTGSTDAYLNASWTHAHSHSHVVDPASFTSGVANATGGSTSAADALALAGHAHTINVPATTSDTDATNSPTITVKRTRVNYIIKT